jgi:5,5'-dehydrodivanillate O-demethylase
MDANAQRRADRFKLLTEIGRETPMGTLLRQFWHPVAIASDVAIGKARKVRVLGEDLTLYRGESGKPYLVAGRCAHRCTVLHTGWIKDDQIRCMYHGWRYDGTGLCTEIPAEDKPRPQPVRIAAYPVQEYCGLLFAYLGQAPAPGFDLPKKHDLEAAGVHTMVTAQVWDCHWFQQIENSLDPVHLGFAHRWGQVGQFGEAVTAAIPQLSYTETSAGIRQVAKRSEDNIRISDWTFPNNNHVVAPGSSKNDPWIHLTSWPVPMDETHTVRFTIYGIPISDTAKIKELREKYDIGFSPAEHSDVLFGEGRVPDVHETGLINSQDYVAVRGQGSVCDRNQEDLSSSDAGVVFLRRIFWRELEAIQQSRPTKRWTRLGEAIHMPTPPLQAAE